MSDQSQGDPVLEFRQKKEPKPKLAIERFEVHFLWTNGEGCMGVDIELQDRNGKKGYNMDVMPSGCGYVPRRDTAIACAERLETLARLLRERYER